MTNPEASRSVLGDMPRAERARTAFEVTLNSLRNAIISGRIPGGTHLAQATLARELGVSTTPVREALRQLSSEGIVELDAHRGAVVASVDLAELLEIYEIRSLLEPRCMELVATQISDQDLARAGDLQSRMEAESDIGAWAILNREFHQTLCRAAGVSRLVAILQGLHAADALYVGVGLRMAPHALEAGNEDHRRLLSALQQRDPAAAAEASLLHIRNTIELTKLANRATLPGPASDQDPGRPA